MRKHFSVLLDNFLTFADLRRHYPSDYLLYDTFLHKPTNFDYLVSVPSQTTIRERLYLYNFFRFQWSGGKVLEVGPFLGGTTRAIGMGMLESRVPNIVQEKLLTVDEFENYQTREQLLDLGVPLNLFKSQDSLRSNERMAFKDVFDHYSTNQPYSHLLRSKNFRIPEFPSQSYNSASLRDIVEFCEGEEALECIFVDGAKSYHSLFFILTKLKDSLRPGTRLIFQDYLKVSCWWIPLIMGSLQRFFKVESIIDSTVCFLCIDPSSLANEIHKILPTEMSDFSQIQIHNSFNSEVSRTLAGYSKKLRVICRNQEMAALRASGSRVSWGNPNNVRSALHLFPRTLSYLNVSREVSTGKFDER